MSLLEFSNQYSENNQRTQCGYFRFRDLTAHPFAVWILNNLMKIHNDVPVEKR